MSRKVTKEERNHMAVILIECRESLNMNQREFADYMDISTRMLQKYEQSKAPIPDYLKIDLRKKCKVDLNQLMCANDDTDGNVVDEDIENRIMFERIVKRANMSNLLDFSEKINHAMRDKLNK